MAEIENIHCPICTQPIPSSWQNDLPPAFATLEQRGGPVIPVIGRGPGTGWPGRSHFLLLLPFLLISESEKEMQQLGCSLSFKLLLLLFEAFWASLIFSPYIVIGEIDPFCVPRGQRQSFLIYMIFIQCINEIQG